MHERRWTKLWSDPFDQNFSSRFAGWPASMMTSASKASPFTNLRKSAANLTNFKRTASFFLSVLTCEHGNELDNKVSRRLFMENPESIFYPERLTERAMQLMGQIEECRGWHLQGQLKQIDLCHRIVYANAAELQRMLAKHQRPEVVAELWGSRAENPSTWTSLT